VYDESMVEKSYPVFEFIAGPISRGTCAWRPTQLGLSVRLHLYGRGNDCKTSQLRNASGMETG
jgi:hypothetical protein